MDESYLVDLNAEYTSIPLLTSGDTIPLLEGEFPFLQTDPNAAFPVDNLGEVDSGDNPLFPSTTGETFTFIGNVDGVSHTNIDGTNYVFVNHSLGSDATTDGPVNGSRISLLAFDEDWGIIGGRDLVNIVRIASVEANNALREAGLPGLILAQYIFNPETGNFEANLEGGVTDGTFISGNPEFLNSPSDVPGQTWLERLEDSFPPVYNSLQIPGQDNYPNLSSISIAETGFRRRGGQALPFIFNGDGVDNGVAHFHIANGISVPIVGFGAFARSQVISALDFRAQVGEDGVPFGDTILLSSEASEGDAELYMWVGNRVPGNTNGFVDFEDNLYVLQVTDGAGNVIADDTGITEGTSFGTKWVLVDGNPLNDLSAVPEGNAINTLDADALSDWVNGSDDGVLRSTNFTNFGGLAEDPTNTGSFYVTSPNGLYNLTFADGSPTAGAGTFTLLQTGDFDSVAVDDDGQVIVQDNGGSSFIYDVTADTLTPFVEVNQAEIDPDGAPPWQIKGITAVDGNFNDTGLSAYLSTVSANSLTDDAALGVGGQLLLNAPNAESRFDNDIFRFQSNITPGTYLFVGAGEAQNIRDNFADSFTEEGFAYTAASQPGDDLSALYRFISNQGTYLFVGEQERSEIISDPNLSGVFTEEGLAFYVYGAGSGEGTGFNRLRNVNLPGAYLYASGGELTNIQANFGDTYVDEGAAFEVVV